MDSIDKIYIDKKYLFPKNYISTLKTIIIIGAGINGLYTLLKLLENNKFNIILLEKRIEKNNIINISNKRKNILVVDKYYKKLFNLGYFKYINKCKFNRIKLHLYKIDNIESCLWIQILNQKRENFYIKKIKDNELNFIKKINPYIVIDSSGNNSKMSKILNPVNKIKYQNNIYYLVVIIYSNIKTYNKYKNILKQKYKNNIKTFILKYNYAKLKNMNVKIKLKKYVSKKDFIYQIIKIKDNVFPYDIKNKLIIKINPNYNKTISKKYKNINIFGIGDTIIRADPFYGKGLYYSNIYISKLINIINNNSLSMSKKVKEYQKFHNDKISKLFPTIKH